jgi:hypothetical protein
MIKWLKNLELGHLRNHFLSTSVLDMQSTKISGIMDPKSLVSLKRLFPLQKKNPESQFLLSVNSGISTNKIGKKGQEKINYPNLP